MRQYKCAVIGVGFIGAAHIEALRRLGNVSVVAVCDESGAKEKAEQFNIPFAYTSYTKMIDELELDAVHICTPNFTHYEIAKYAIEKGVNFICEKPFTTTAEQAKDLASLAKAKGVKGAVNLHNRLYPMPNEMHEMVKSGEIGEVLTVDGSYIQDWLMYETDYSWRLVGSQVGKTRAVSDIGSHLLDLAEFVTGLTITDVCAQFKTVYPTRKKPLAKIETFEKAEARAACQDIKIDTEDAAIVMLKFDNGAIGSAIVSQVFAGKKNSTRLMVAGSKASLVWDSEQLSELYIGHRDSANEILTKDANLMHKASTKTVSYPSGHVEG
ncbi:MAG: Gfo/Idh/MocA family oxidoreductase, partial [Oscillospiraceae bacterium]